jgi:integrase
VGHIHKRTQAGTIRWRARYQAPDGTERSRSFVRKVDAERFLAEVETDKARGTWTDPALAQIAFADWSDQWLRTTTHLKPKTRAGYESTLRTHLLPAFGPLPIGKIRGSHVREVLAGMQAQGLSASACRQVYYLLSSILRAAIDDGRIRTSPCTGIKLPRLPNVEMQFLDPSQLRDVLQAIDARYRLFVELLAISGLRFGEGAALRRCRCDLERSRITVAENAVDVRGKLVFGSPKTHQVRTVVLPSFLSDHLEEHLTSAGAPDSFVFTSPRGGPVRYGNFLRRVWKPTLKGLYAAERG